jgi:ribonuclease P protein component
LQRGHEFRRVYEQGRRIQGRLMALYVCAAPAERERRAVGVVTGRKVGGAITRNRARRLLREAYRRNKNKLRNNVHLVIVARSAIRGKPFGEVERELIGLLETANNLAES